MRCFSLLALALGLALALSSVASAAAAQQPQQASAISAVAPAAGSTTTTDRKVVYTYWEGSIDCQNGHKYVVEYTEGAGCHQVRPYHNPNLSRLSLASSSALVKTSNVIIFCLNQVLTIDFFDYILYLAFISHLHLLCLQFAPCSDACLFPVLFLCLLSLFAFRARRFSARATRRRSTTR